MQTPEEQKKAVHSALRASEEELLTVAQIKALQREGKITDKVASELFGRVGGKTGSGNMTPEARKERSKTANQAYIDKIL